MTLKMAFMPDNQQIGEPIYQKGSRIDTTITQ
jgi:hypothetical protein